MGMETSALRRSKRDSDGWISSLALAVEPTERNRVLVMAQEPLEKVACAVARENGLAPIACKTPLQAIQYLVREGGRIAYAIISSAANGGVEMRRLLADEFPDIKPVMLVG